MSRSETHPKLYWFAWFAAFNTLLLIALGGLVTSKGAGMAVPDWPTTYGQNMFLFPPSQWTGGIFYEHTHRLMGSWVGLLTVVLALWLWRSEPRAWMRRLGWIALFLVILQGVLGGLRVVLFKNEIGIFHAGLAQSFLSLLTVIALACSPLWRRIAPQGDSPRVRRALGVGVLLVFVQLLIGATMRHQHAGLAVPDFPLAYGRLWPATDADTLAHINLSHADHTVTAFQILVHMVHRIGALVVFVGSLWITRTVVREVGTRSGLGRGVMVWQGLIVLQACLGAATVWTGRAPDIATLHVVVGAACLSGAVLLTVVAFCRALPVRATPVARGTLSTSRPPAPPVPASR